MRRLTELLEEVEAGPLDRRLLGMFLAHVAGIPGCLAEIKFRCDADEPTRLAVVALAEGLRALRENALSKQQRVWVGSQTGASSELPVTLTNYD